MERNIDVERNIDQLPLTCPQLGTWLATQACALTEIEPETFPFSGWYLVH